MERMGIFKLHKALHRACSDPGGMCDPSDPDHLTECHFQVSLAPKGAFLNVYINMCAGAMTFKGKNFFTDVSDSGREVQPGPDSAVISRNGVGEGGIYRVSELI